LGSTTTKSTPYFEYLEAYLAMAKNMQARAGQYVSFVPSPRTLDSCVDATTKQITHRAGAVSCSNDKLRQNTGAIASTAPQSRHTDRKIYGVA